MIFKNTETHEIGSRCLDLLRIFLGGALFVKGVYFILNMQNLAAITPPVFEFNSHLLTHYIVIAHIAGGICLLFGLKTKLAAAFNIPILIGAIVFVHSKESLFSQGQGMELAVMVLVSLVLFTIAGSGKWSVDHYIETSTNEDEEIKHSKGRKLNTAA